LVEDGFPSGISASRAPRQGSARSRHAAVTDPWRFIVQNGQMRPDDTVGGLAAAIVALIVVAALATAFATLAREEDEPPPRAVVTIER
jgi:hypothetical protein